MNQLNNGNAVNPPAVPMKLPYIKFKTGMPKSVPLNKDPIIDIKRAITINFLFESSNFFKIPIKMNDKPANAKISTQKSNNPPAIGNMSQLPNKVPQT